MQPIHEFCSNTEVTTAATQAPEKIRVLFGAGTDDISTSGYDGGRQQVVDRQAHLAVGSADTTAKREASAARMRDDARSGHRVMCCRCDINVAKQTAAIGSNGHRAGIDICRMHLRQINHHPAITGRFARHTVTTALNRCQQLPLTGEINRVYDVINGGTLHDHCWSLVVEHAIPDLFGGVVAFVSLEKDRALQAIGEFGNGSGFDRQLVAVHRHGGNRQTRIARLLACAAG